MLQSGALGGGGEAGMLAVGAFVMEVEDKDAELTEPQARPVG